MKPGIIVALDFKDFDSARNIVEKLDNNIDYYKVGLEAFVSFGKELIDLLKSKNKKIFLDLKFHDIPNTVSAAALASLKYGVDIINLHIQGGIEMMKTTVNAINEKCEKENIKKPLIIGVTLLTSLDTDYFNEYNINFDDTLEYVLHLAELAANCGLDGVVSSAKETKAVKDKLGKDFITITPGIRPAFAVANDQKRVVTPKDAKKLGTDFMVIGRPITQSENPVDVVKLIKEELI